MLDSNESLDLKTYHERLEQQRIALRQLIETSNEYENILPAEINGDSYQILLNYRQQLVDAQTSLKGLMFYIQNRMKGGK